jgi:hypothetical protein
MASNATYLYCIVHAAQAPRVSRAPQGLPGGTRPRVVPAARSLWVVVADVPLDVYGPEPLATSLRDMAWVAAVAVAHEAVVEHFSRQADVTVIPTTLFTMFSSAERAAQQTRSRRRDLTAVLRRIAGCEEWGVRMLRTAPRGLRSAPPASASRATENSAVSGAAFLAAKKRVRDENHDAVRALAGAADSVFETLAAVARDARRRGGTAEGSTTPPVLDAAFLVPVARRTQFRSAARRLAAGVGPAGGELTLTGPWPAYNFVQAEGR